MTTILNALGLLSGLLSVVCLYMGTIGMPWTLQSWKGETPAEQRFQRKRRCWSVTGFVLLAVGFALQLAALLLQK
jgi:hypothetical protein